MCGSIIGRTGESETDIVVKVFLGPVIFLEKSESFFGKKRAALEMTGKASHKSDTEF